MFFSSMEIEQLDEVSVETIELQSKFLSRTARIDFYQRNPGESNEVNLLLINDGQDIEKMNMQEMLTLTSKPLLVAAIHCGPDRKNEYGMSVAPNADGFGAKAHLYEQFIIEELLLFINSRFGHFYFKEIAFAGFSLGALSALDITWNNPGIFSRAGVFSGSLWWRSVSKEDKDYNQDIHRMMHAQVRKGSLRPGMKFFFECGEQDEWEDRNKNGVIDSIDDTIDLMRELIRKGYREGRDILYLQIPDGKHDVISWEKAMPLFLNWGWGK
jgi:enterochelin esterase-like enzyme